jgi:hypothetical protein
MSEIYYNGYGKPVSKEEFDLERKELIAERFKELEDKENLIPYEDMDYYLAELKKLW